MKNGTLDAVSNAATFQTEVTLIDDDTDTVFDMGDVSAITVKLRDPNTLETVLSGSLSGGEIVQVGADADGLIRITFSATAMAAVEPKTYELGLLVTDTDGFVSQIVLGRLPVLRGL